MEEARKRPCPACRQGSVLIRDLHEGARCDGCNALIESDFVYTAGIPVLLALVTGLAFSSDLAWLGFLCTFLLVLFTAGYQTIVPRFIPIRHYGDSD